jgi:hypothetical protein
MEDFLNGLDQTIIERSFLSRQKLISSGRFSVWLNSLYDISKLISEVLEKSDREYFEHKLPLLISSCVSGCNTPTFIQSPRVIDHTYELDSEYLELDRIFERISVIDRFNLVNHLYMSTKIEIANSIMRLAPVEAQLSIAMLNSMTGVNPLNHCHLCLKEGWLENLEQSFEFNDAIHLDFHRGQMSTSNVLNLVKVVTKFDARSFGYKLAWLQTKEEKYFIDYMDTQKKIESFFLEETPKFPFGSAGGSQHINYLGLLDFIRRSELVRSDNNPFELFDKAQNISILLPHSPALFVSHENDITPDSHEFFQRDPINFLRNTEFVTGNRTYHCCPVKKQ